MNMFGDHALFRPKGFTASVINVVYDLREVQVFDEASGTAVDTFQIWFFLSDCAFIRNHAPKIGDEIIFEGSGYNIVATNPLGDGGMWVRCHQAEKATPTNNVGTRDT